MIFFSSASSKLGSPDCSSGKLLSKGWDRGSNTIVLKVNCGDLSYNSYVSRRSQLSKDRIEKGITSKELGRLADVSPYLVSTYERKLHAYGMNDIGALKRLAVALGYPEDRYLDDYLKWLDGDPYEDIRALLIAHRGNGVDLLAERCSVTRQALYHWRDGQGAPTRESFEIVKKRGSD